jgi:hypothetical protein
MPTNTPHSPQAISSNAPAAALAQATRARGMSPATASSSAADSARKPSGYGLPCSRCRLYYPADLDACPNCHHNQRVSPVAAKVAPKAAQAAADHIPDSTTVEQERENFLQQFDSQLLEAHAEAVNTPGSVCALTELHAGNPAGAEVCKSCYQRLQERLDVYEAALHMDLKEAAQIVYDAVWADPSDSSKTYQNAACALLTELRKRAGVSVLLGSFQPLSH